MKTTAFARELPSRLHYLDILRGVAALCVVLYHWVHFSFDGIKAIDFEHRLMPFYTLLWPLYEQGYRAVGLFFCLSGFIFFWLYAVPIQQRQIGLAKFAWLRFSRLYPLHFATLIFVLIAQLSIKSSYGEFFVYPYNDVRHFILQLFLASNWGFQQGPSFNGPTWSVSVEILLYFIFAITCLLKFTRWWQIIAIIFLSLLLAKIQVATVQTIVYAIVAFFCGGLTFKLYRYAHRKSWIWNRAPLIVLLLFCILMWMCAPFIIGNGLISSLDRIESKFRLLRYLPIRFYTYQFSYNFYEVVVFPLTILLLALTESYRAKSPIKFAFIGELSYSSYLLHFPLQIVFYSVAQSYGVEKSLIHSPLVFISFFAMLIPFSFLSYRYFERPVQSKLRKMFVHKVTRS